MYLTAAALGVVTTTALVSLTTFAHPGDATTTNPMAERHQLMVSTFDDNNYDGWAAQMREQVATMRARADALEANINEGTFAKLREAHQLLADGKVDEAKTIFESLGMSGPGHKMMFMRGMKSGQPKAESDN